MTYSPAIATANQAIANGKSRDARLWANVLADVPLFSGMSKRHIRHVAGLAREARYQPGSAIVVQGAPGNDFFIVIDGEASVLRGSTLPRIPVGPGAYFGEMSLIDDAPRSATAMCHERCRLFVVNRKDLEDLLFIDRDLAYELLWNWVRTLSKRLRATNDKMTFLATTSKF